MVDDKISKLTSKQIKQVQEIHDLATGKSESKELEPELRCSFCRKLESEVSKLIAGPEVFICDKCVVTCVNVLHHYGIPVETEK